MRTPRASIIISTWNGRPLLEACLPLVLRAVAQAGGDHEVIVVDDASTDDTVSCVRREFPQVRLLALKRNLRFAGANNAAARIARGEFLVFLNNDMLVEPDFLEPLLRPFRDPTVFAVTAHIEMAPSYVDGREVRETGMVRTRFEDGLFVLRHEEVSAADSAPVIYAGGGSSAWRRTRFWQLGGFDRLFRPFYFEDLDLSYRAQKAGWQVLFQPASRMLHKHRQTNNPRNFPPGYVDLMFGKNTLLFTWKVLTDPRLLNTHFRRLWHLLMRSRTHPQMAPWFLRACAQLPELLWKRHLSRPRLARPDREVLRLAAPAPPLQPVAGGLLPLETKAFGAGRRLLLVGFAPLPFEREPTADTFCQRTWQVAQTLAGDGHQLLIVGCRRPESYADAHARPPLLRFEGKGCTYYSCEPSVFEEGKFLATRCEEFDPEAIVAIHSYCAWAASRLDTTVPLWADLCEPAVAAAQARAAISGSDAEVLQAWRWEHAALVRADALSVMTAAHRQAVTGELGAVGRLVGASFGRDVVRHMPTAVEASPYRHRKQVIRGALLKEDDFVVLWVAGEDASCDVDTLIAGVSAAMQQDPRVRFLSVGGAPEGPHQRLLSDLRQRAEQSGLGDRFLFLGRVPGDDLPNYYFESDVGLNVDHACYEMLAGPRCRLLEMMKAGLPVLTTFGPEISHLVRDERLGLTFPAGDPAALASAILILARDESLRRRLGERAKQHVLAHRTLEQAMAPLREWARSPAPAPERVALMWPVGPPAHGAPIPSAVPSPPSLRSLGQRAAAFAADLLAKLFIRRRPAPAWGLDPREPPQRALVIRAGSLTLIREAVEHIRARYPAAEVTVLAPAELAAETRCETGPEVIEAPGAGSVSYRITADLIRMLHRGDFDTVVVAGEGNHRAEALALLAGLMRRVEVRDDGAAHTFGLAPHKPLLLLALLTADALQKLTLSALLGLVWGGLHLEGQIWDFRQRLRQTSAAR